MYFWNLKKLEEIFRKGPLSEKEILSYFIFTVVLSAAYMIPFTAVPNVWDIAVALAYVCISIFGILYTYHCNKGEKGENFLQKYIALGWVVGIRYMLIIGIPLVFLYFLILGMYVDIIEHTSVHDLIIEISLAFIFYYFLGKSIKRTLSHKK